MEPREHRQAQRPRTYWSRGASTDCDDEAYGAQSVPVHCIPCLKPLIWAARWSHYYNVKREAQAGVMKDNAVVFGYHAKVLERFPAVRAGVVWVRGIDYRAPNGPLAADAIDKLSVAR